jgi:hypothetical protein
MIFDGGVVNGDDETNLQLPLHHIVARVLGVFLA